MHKPTQELDKVLNFIISDELAALTYDTIRDETGIENIKTLLEILGKLEKDGYIEKRVMDVDNVSVDYYCSTFDGRLFSETSGYEMQNKKQKTSIRNEYFRTLFLTYGTAFAGVYGVFEIFKWLFHHEGWHLPF